jgi:Glucose-regulated metallo-peptidase M90
MPPDSTYSIPVYLMDTLSDGAIVSYKNDSSSIIEAKQYILIRETAIQHKEQTGDNGLLLGLFSIFGIVMVINWLYDMNRQKEKGAADMESAREILELYFPGFLSYTALEKDIFVKRVVAFVDYRIFEFSFSCPDVDKAQFLISAVAVQLTFGLDNYLLKYFNRICVHQNDYYYGIYPIPFQGHTSNGEIHFSWSSFLEGISDATDKQNVGLHEMAHAITYECFNVGNKGDTHFKNEFANFSKVARPLFNKIQLQPNSYLGNYAATNYNEFWAVSVEAFFEQPQQLYNAFPTLYIAIAKLLKQDFLGKA